jgi:hypothetical protein
MNPLAIMSSMSGAKPPDGDELKKMCNDQQTDDVNEEWKNVLKDQMPEVATACIDAICAFLSNDNMQSCENTSEFNPPTYMVEEFNPPTYMVEEVKKILVDYISSEPAEISRYLLCYIPESTEPKKIQGGGPVPDLAALAGAGADLADALPSAVPGADALTVPGADALTVPGADAGAGALAALPGAGAGALAALPGAGAGAGALAALPGAGALAALPGAGAGALAGSIPGAVPGAGDLAGAGAGALADLAGAGDLTGAVPGLAGAGALAGAVPGLNISPKKNEISDGKAKTILTKFKSDIVSKFKCDEPTTQYIKDKIIDTMVRAIRNKLIDDNENKTTDIKQLLSSIAKETTTQSINKQISLIQPTIELYKNIIDKGDATVTAMILPDYLRLLLEMFLYTGYGEMLPDGKIKLSIKPSYISSHIAKIQNVEEFNKELDELMKHRPDNILLSAMEQFIQLDTAKTKTKVDNQANSINNQKALDKFKALFEKGTEEVKIGGKKKHTRKKKRHHKKRRSTRRYR